MLAPLLLTSGCLEPLLLAEYPVPTPMTVLESFIKPRVEETETQFGSAVLISGTEILVGAPISSDCGLPFTEGAYPDLTCTRQGAVNIIQPDSTGGPTYRVLKADQAQTGESFGRRLALFEPWLLVGAPNRDGGEFEPGAVHPFRRFQGLWQPEPRLEAPNPGQSDNLGQALALNAEWAAVYAPRTPCRDEACLNTLREGQGAVHLFHLDAAQWRYAQTLWPISESPQLVAAPVWGGLSLSENRLVVGAPNDANCQHSPNSPEDQRSCPEAGAVFVFEARGTTWIQTAYLKPATPAPSQNFGQAVATLGGRIFVGAGREGAVYIFDYDPVRQTWSQSERLTIPAGASAEYGASIDALGDELLVGAPYEGNCATGINPRDWRDECLTPQGVGPGAAFLYAHAPGGHWEPQLYLKGRSSHPTSAFGAAVKLTSERIIIGAPGEPNDGRGLNQPGADSGIPIGAAFVYDRGGTP